MKRLSRTLEAQLRPMIRTMSRDSRIYKMLKQELKALGHWKNKSPGPRQGHPDFHLYRKNRPATGQTYEPLSD